MAIGTETPTTTKELNLQARAEQLEAVIEEGHKIVDRMLPEPATQTETAGGAVGALIRCQENADRLNDRLRSLADQVGTL